jgi:Flp pilus assembly protein TadB
MSDLPAYRFFGIIFLFVLGVVLLVMFPSILGLICALGLWVFAWARFFPYRGQFKRFMRGEDDE